MKAKYIVKYGGFIHRNATKRLISTYLNYLTSPEYSLKEGFRTMRGKGLDFTMNARWEEIKNVDFTKEIETLNVPLYFFQGKYDMIVPTVQVQNYYNALQAEKGKKLIIFEDSAHVPMLEEKEKYEGFLINVVLKETLSK